MHTHTRFLPLISRTVTTRVQTLKDLISNNDDCLLSVSTDGQKTQSVQHVSDSGQDPASIQPERARARGTGSVCGPGGDHGVSLLVSVRLFLQVVVSNSYYDQQDADASVQPQADLVSVGFGSIHSKFLSRV